MRRTAVLGIVVAGAILTASCAAPGVPTDQVLANVKPFISKSVLAFDVDQASPPEMLDSGTVMVQLALWPKDELADMAKGVCREIASYIRGEKNQSAYPDLVQIYGINGDYWLQCQPRDIPINQAQHYRSDECDAAINQLSTMSSDDLARREAEGLPSLLDAC